MAYGSVTPRFVRPFWVESRIGGPGNEWKGTGPRTLDVDGSEFNTRILIRNKGEVMEACQIAGYIDAVTGLLKINVFGPDGANVLHVETER